MAKIYPVGSGGSSQFDVNTAGAIETIDDTLVVEHAETRTIAAGGTEVALADAAALALGKLKLVAPSSNTSAAYIGFTGVSSTQYLATIANTGGTADIEIPPGKTFDLQDLYFVTATTSDTVDIVCFKKA